MFLEISQNLQKNSCARIWTTASEAFSRLSLFCSESWATSSKKQHCQRFESIVGKSKDKANESQDVHNIKFYSFSFPSDKSSKIKTMMTRYHRSTPPNYSTLHSNIHSINVWYQLSIVSYYHVLIVSIVSIVLDSINCW